MGANLDREILAFMRERIERLGETGSGAHSYYAGRVKNGYILFAYDHPIASFIHEHAPGYSKYIEAGAGIGQLVALIAGQGRSAIGVESDKNRYLAMADLFKRLKLNAEAVCGIFPEVILGRCTSDTLVIFTNVAIRRPEAEPAFLNAASRCGAMIVDLSRFVMMRDTDEERQELSDRIEAIGFESPAPVYCQGHNRVMFFKRRT